MWIVTTMWIIIAVLQIISSVIFLIGSGLLIASGKLLKSNDFGDWSDEPERFTKLNIRYECNLESKHLEDREKFIREYGDTRNWDDRTDDLF